MRIQKSTTIPALVADSAAAAPLGLYVTTVRLVGTVDAYVALNTPALVTSFFLPAKLAEMVQVAPGDVLHVMRAGAVDGVVNVVEIN